MAKCIPYEKVSKKEKRKIAQARRQAWGELNPVTRNRKVYNRKRTQDWKRELPDLRPNFYSVSSSKKNTSSTVLKYLLASLRLCRNTRKPGCLAKRCSPSVL